MLRSPREVESSPPRERLALTGERSFPFIVAGRRRSSPRSRLTRRPALVSHSGTARRHLGLRRGEGSRPEILIGQLALSSTVSLGKLFVYLYISPRSGKAPAQPLLLGSQRTSPSTSLVKSVVYLNGSSRQAVAPPLALRSLDQKSGGVDWAKSLLCNGTSGAVKAAIPPPHPFHWFVTPSFIPLFRKPDHPFWRFFSERPAHSDLARDTERSCLTFSHPRFQLLWRPKEV